MICSFSVENYKAFAGKVELDFYANMNIKRFAFNSVEVSNKNILKTIGFYGPNNTGKTCIALALLDLRALMLNEVHSNFANAFMKHNEITSFSVEYFINGRFYVYSVSYHNQLKQYLNEKLLLKTYNEDSVKHEKIFERNENLLSWDGLSNDFRKANVTKLFSNQFPFMIVFDDDSNAIMKRAREDYLSFAHSLLFLKMNSSIDITKTIRLLQSDEKARKFIKEFVKNCDLHIDDFEFDDNIVSDADIDEQLKHAINNPIFNRESLKLYSKHNGYRVPSIFFDSIGTMKLIALSGYIYEAITEGKILVVDEIESSLHHILTKSIVAMFNNSLNKRAQLVFTTQDVLLLDLKRMFRKDQIYLVDIRDRNSSEIYRLSEFTSRTENGIRGDEDITDYYLKGQFGSIPTPDLFSSLEDIVNDE